MYKAASRKNTLRISYCEIMICFCLQRRAGVLAGGKGSHVDLGKSWTELGLLAQCTSRAIQEGLK